MSNRELRLKSSPSCFSQEFHAALGPARMKCISNHWPPADKKKASLPREETGLGDTKNG
jgi:hypothetical protein